MSDFLSLVKSLVALGFSNREAMEAAQREKERECELFYCYFIVAFFDNRIFRQLGDGEDEA